MSLNDYHLSLSDESCYRNLIILDEINKSFSKMASLCEKNAEDEIDIVSEATMHYAKRFEELYMLFNKRIGR